MADTFTIAARADADGARTRRRTSRRPRRPSPTPRSRGAGRLPAGAVHRLLLLPEGRRRALRPRRADPRAVVRDRLAAAAKENGVVVVGSLFEKRMAGRLPQHRHRPRRDGRTPRPLPQDAHPGRPALPREVLLHPRRPRLQGLRPRRPRRSARSSAGTSGIPEAARLTALQGAEVIFYPTAIGWHPKEKAEYGEAQHSAWETSMRGHAIANGTYVARGQPRRPRGHRRRGARILGRVVRLRPVRPHPEEGQPRQGRNPGRDVRPEADGRRAAELAVLPRPPHRCVRRHHEARGGLIEFGEPGA